MKQKLLALCSSKKRKLTGKIENAFREEVLREKDPRCSYCDCTLTGENFNADHYDPLSNGGAQHFSNMRPACDHCNSVKQAKVPVDIERKAGEKTKRSQPMLGGLTSRCVRKIYLKESDSFVYIFRGWVPEIVALYKRIEDCEFYVLRRGYRAVVCFDRYDLDAFEKAFEGLNGFIHDLGEAR